MTERPYAGLRIEELEGLVSSNSDDPDGLARVRSELKYRKTARAIKLARHIQALIGGDSPQQLTMSTPPSSSYDRKVTPIPAHERQITPGGDLSWQQVGSQESLAEKYEVLRVTFTVEGELLARWGMTPLMPRDMQDLIFTEWAKRLGGVGNEGPSPDSLRRDLERLERERKVLQIARKRAGVPTPKLNSGGQAVNGGTR